MKNVKKQAFTLLEIMIVICLIGLIGGVISYNMKGSLEEGKAFKTERAKEQIYDILMLEVARGHEIEEVVENPREFLMHSGLAKDPDTLLADGWGQAFEIHANGSEIIIHSAAYEKYKERKKNKLSSSTKKQGLSDPS